MAKKLYQSAAKFRTAVAELIYILPFNCTDVAPKCDEEIVTKAAVPNSLPVVTSRHPPFFVTLLGFINDTDSETIAAAVAPHGGRLNNRLDR